MFDYRGADRKMSAAQSERCDCPGLDFGARVFVPHHSVQRKPPFSKQANRSIFGNNVFRLFLFISVRTRFIIAGLGIA
jgi:hypothetical protein